LKGQGAAVASMLIAAERRLAIDTDSTRPVVLASTEQAACGHQPPDKLDDAAMNRL